MDTAQLSGRELDKAIAERLFGIKKIFQPGEYARGDMYFGSCNEYAYIPSGKSPRTHMIDAKPIPCFSESIEAAMQIVELFRRGTHAHAAAVIEMKVSDVINTKDCYCHIYGPDLAGGEAWTNSMPEAICLAALAAIEGE